MSQDRNNLIEQKGKKRKRGKQRPQMEARAVKDVILYFPAAETVQLPPRKQGFNMCSGCSGEQIPSTNVTHFHLSLRFYI